MKSYHTLRKINRPIKFFGLTSLQLGGVCLIVALLIILMIAANKNPVAIIFFVVVVISGLSFLLGKLNVEHKKGNPDYLVGEQVKTATPKKIKDGKKIFGFLMKHKR